MKTIAFVTRNRNKVREANEILKEFDLFADHKTMPVSEIQSDKVEEIARHSALEAYVKLRLPLIVEDAGLFIQHLAGFPGAYSAYVHSTIGNAGILKLMDGVASRKAVFRSALAYCGRLNRVLTFAGSVLGQISTEERGRGWGYDPIFRPRGFNETYAEMGHSKNEISHRKISTEKFARWFVSHS